MATLQDDTIRARIRRHAAPPGAAMAAKTGNAADDRRDEVPIDLERTAPMRRWSWIVVMLLASVLFCWLTYALSWQRGVADLRVNAGARVERYAGSLRSTVDRYEFLPYLLSLHPYVHDLLLNPKDKAVVQRANDYLFDVNQRAKASAAYVIDANGLALAASNWREKATFVGQEYRFRPYFIDAIKGAFGRFYGVGTTSGEPGYFVSQPILVDGQIHGVVVVKLNLEWFQRAGADAAEPVVVADDHGVIFLSSEPRWQYRSLTPLTPDVKAALESTRQYYNQHVTPLAWSEDERLDADGEVVTVRDAAGPRATGKTRRFLAVQRKLGEPDWTLMYFAPLDQVIANARIAAVAAACLAAFTCLLGVAWNQRRQRVRDMLKSRELLQSAYAELGERVAERTADLQSANERLQTEVQERARTEHELREAQSELVQASKLVALGQMAAGITHELNQPLSALRSFSDNTRVLIERREYNAAQENLEAIASLTDRMGKITGQLRLFAGRARRGDMDASVRRAIDNTLMLLRGRLAGVQVTTTFANGLDDVQVACEGLRLEQVLINLVGNAIDAVVGAPGPQASPSIWIDVDADDLWVRIYVRDNGPGIAEAHMPRLFEPFFSTKEGGQGMGLGLAISSSIAQENGGQLVARNVPGGGAEFLVTLRRVQAAGATNA
ncbi:two-component sensor histidine kinase [Pandoraea captiosa]|uniref:C4-dicarboxylate transport sensor protein DctB n=1 Tax=Pandoraea captiosa TaxID=2508302 RepID=A0A5E4ZW64_9BURK|nr:two-component sensor histidine kinase [Pandoraea captiosa]